MNKFFNLNFWFNMRPGSADSKFMFGFVIFIAVLAIFAFIFTLLKNRQRSLYFKIWQKLQMFCLTNFGISLLLLFFVYEHIPVLSARFIILFWVLSMIVWLVFIVRTITKIPELRNKLEKEKEYKKYIP